MKLFWNRQKLIAQYSNYVEHSAIKNFEISVRKTLAGEAVKIVH